MKAISITVLLLLVSTSYSCKVKGNILQQHTSEGKPVHIPVREHSMQAVLWQQVAAEYEALTYQAYNIATERLKALLADSVSKKNLAIVTDIDETILDNSPYNAKMIEQDLEYSREGWEAWGKLQQARAVPGAVDFFQFAKDNGVDIYYISNRYQSQYQETKANLVALGFPISDEGHLLLRTDGSGKQLRRAKVNPKAEVVMLLGDNLADFSEVFENKSTGDRKRAVSDLKAEFGSRFIVFPNPMYGDWETKGLYQGNYKWSAYQKDSIRRASLSTY